MTSTDPEEFKSDWLLKLERAKKHLHDLRVIHDQYLASAPFGAKLEERPDELVWRLEVGSMPPQDLALTFGDAIHNMRSALDCRVIAIAEKVAGERLSNSKLGMLSFILPEEPNFEKRSVEWVAALGLSGEAVTKCLRVFLPYGEPSEFWSFGDEHFPQDMRDATLKRLKRLIWLSNQDKHRRLNLLCFRPAGASYSFGGVSITWAQGLLTPGDIICSLSRANGIDSGELNMKIDIDLRIEGAKAEGTFDFCDELENILYFVECSLQIMDFEEVRFLESKS